MKKQYGPAHTHSMKYEEIGMSFTDGMNYDINYKYQIS